MKNVLLFAAAAAALTGCNPSESGSEETAALEEATPTPAAMTTANGSTPGTFEVTAPDGTKSQTVLNADGTYVDTDSDGAETRGAWSVMDNKTCFDPDGDEGPTCFTETEVAEDGTFTATSDAGEAVTVRKVG